MQPYSEKAASSSSNAGATNPQSTAEVGNETTGQPQPQPRLRTRSDEEPVHPWTAQPAPASPRITATRNEIIFFGAPDANGVSNTASITASTASTANMATEQCTSPDNDPDHLPPLLHATPPGDLPEVDALFAASAADLAQIGNEDRWSALMLAVANGHLDVVERLLTVPGTDLDQTNQNGDNVLILAARNNRPHVLGRLLDAGAKVNGVSITDSKTALICAVDQRSLQMVQLLLQQEEIDIDFLPDQCGNALMRAAFDNEVDIVNCLIRAGANVNYIRLSDEEELTPLMWATINNSIDAADALLGHDGIDIQHEHGKHCDIDQQQHACARHQPG